MKDIWLISWTDEMTEEDARHWDAVDLVTFNGLIYDFCDVRRAKKLVEDAWHEQYESWNDEEVLIRKPMRIKWDKKPVRRDSLHIIWRAKTTDGVGYLVMQHRWVMSKAEVLKRERDIRGG